MELSLSAQGGDCFLCREAVHWFDIPIRRTAGIGRVVAAMGPFTTEYVLIAPDAHVPSVVSLPTKDRIAFAGFVQQTLVEATDIWSEWCIWEHGGTSSAVAQSACHDHAHLHVVAGLHQLSLPPDRHAIPISDIQEFILDPPVFCCTGPYLLMGDSTGRLVVCEDPGESQFFRRQLARSAGMDDEWDYLVFPRWELVRRTISSFGSNPR